MRSLSHLTTCLLAATALYSFPALADSDAEIAELKAQVKMLSQRLATLEQERTANQAAQLAPAAGHPAPKPTTNTPPQVAQGAAKPAAGEGEPVVGGSMPGSFKLPGTNTSVKFGGYVKLDAIADVNHAYGAQFANFAAIPLDTAGAANQDGQFNAHARQSRLNMETRTPTDLGELKTFLEIDFFGSARGNANTTNGEGVQLRQAYGQLGHVLAGQTWSNFMDFDAYPESLDYIGPSGLTFIRQSQVRYTDKIDDKLAYSLALENPNTDFTSPTATDVNLSDLPDATAKLQYKDSFGHVALRGLARKLNAGNSASGVEDEDYGWGLGASGKINALEKDALFFQAVYGDGIGRYLFDVAISGNGTTYVSNRVDGQTAYGGYVAYQHYWSKEFRSNLIGGYTGIDNNVALTGITANKEIMSGHINLIWQPMASYKVGVEYMHGFRKLESGVEGDLDRVQGSFMYLF